MSQMTMLELVIVGGGKMGEALLDGLLKAEYCLADNIRVVEPVVERGDYLAERYGVRAGPDANFVDRNQGLDPAAVTILATKPDQIPAAAAAAAEYSNCILSIAAGVTIATLELAAVGPMPIVRAMPNTPALVGQGATAICGNTAATARTNSAQTSYLDRAENILSAVGIVVRTTEDKLDAVTGLSGSGPAYVFLVAEALIDAGVAAGLTRADSSELTVQTLFGASTLLREGTPPAELRANVTSPGGTTAEGLRELEKACVRAAFASAVAAATLRSTELGQATTASAAASAQLPPPAPASSS